MITNATILRVDAPPAVNGFGEEASAEGASIAVRCAVDDSIAQARRELGATLQEATAVFRVPASAGLALAAKGRLLVRGDGEAAARLWQLTYVRPRTKAGGLSHAEAFGREVAAS